MAGTLPAVEMLELMPPPGGGRAYEAEITPGVTDVGGGGRARLDAIADWLQEVARQDLEDAGFGGRGVWIVRRTRIRVEAFPRYGERLTLRTFCSGLGRFSAERRTTISGGGAAVETVSRWICMELDGSRPQRLEGEFRELYAASAGDRDANVRVRHPDPPADAERSPWAFRATDLDIAAHVNNSHYWAPLEEEFLAAGTEPQAFDGEIEHREPAQPGPSELLRSGEMRWIAGQGGELHASICTTQALDSRP
jgi:acyl-ACP thioesterase